MWQFMSWFTNLTGFREESPEQVRANLEVEGTSLKSRVNGRTFVCGRLETPSLGQLRERVRTAGAKVGKTSLGEVVASVQDLHRDVSNAGALFQVASQFNLLEMVSPAVTPEDGVEIYEHDYTQGPACAIAAGAGTIYRNYFAAVNGRIGQTADNQIDCLADLGEALGNADNRLWKMKNGYALPPATALQEISDRLQASGAGEIDRWRQLHRIGIQWQTQVTLGGAKHQVTQAYCSALPVAYGHRDPELWKEFAQLVLDAAYEATLCAGILNFIETGNHKVFLTLLGGGAFGNDIEWILGAILRAVRRHRDSGLDVAIVSYGSSKAYLRELSGRL